MVVYRYLRPFVLPVSFSLYFFDKVGVNGTFYHNESGEMEL